MMMMTEMEILMIEACLVIGILTFGDVFHNSSKKKKIRIKESLWSLSMHDENKDFFAHMI